MNTTSQQSLKSTHLPEIILGRDLSQGGAVVLTCRQAQVLCLLEDGKTNKEIARDLDKSPRTVEDVVECLKIKLATDSRTQLGILSYRYQVKQALRSVGF